MSSLTSLWNAMARRRAPATLGLIALMALALLFHVATGARFAEWLVLDTQAWTLRPWTLLAYPIGVQREFGTELIAVAIGGIWLWGFGPPIEHRLGSRRFVIGLVGISLAVALCFLIGSAALGQAAVLSGFWVLIPAVGVAWAARYPREIVRFMFAIEIPGRFIGILSLVLVLMAVPLLLAPFAALPLLGVWLWAAGKPPFGTSRGNHRRPPARSRSGLPLDDRFLADVRRREQEREERERLRNLFEASLKDDPPPEDKPQ